jgi:YHS domain-containing protein
MDKKESENICKDNSCNSSACCPPPSDGGSGDNCCSPGSIFSWKCLLFFIVLVLAGVVVAHSVWTDQSTNLDESLTAGILGSECDDPAACGCAAPQQEKAETTIMAQVAATSNDNTGTAMEGCACGGEGMEAGPIEQSVVNEAPTVTVVAGTQAVCPIMGNPIKEDVFVDYDGKRVYFCCPGCDGKFNEDPQKYIKQMEDEGIVLAKIVTNGNGNGEQAAATEMSCGGDCANMEGQAVPAVEGESCCGGEEAPVAIPATEENCCGKCDIILEKLTRIEQMLEQLLLSKTSAKTPSATSAKISDSIK